MKKEEEARYSAGLGREVFNLAYTQAGRPFATALAEAIWGAALNLPNDKVGGEDYGAVAFLIRDPYSRPAIREKVSEEEWSLLKMAAGAIVLDTGATQVYLYASRPCLEKAWVGIGLFIGSLEPTKLGADLNTGVEIESVNVLNLP